MAGFRIARRLPPRLLDWASWIDARYQFLRPPSFDLSKIRPRRAYIGNRVAVIGLFANRSGLGRAAHLVAIGLAERGADVIKVDVTEWLGAPKIMTDNNNCMSLEECLHTAVDSIVVVLNPPFFTNVVRHLGRQWLADKCVVAHWVWELNKLPRIWRYATRAADEIWASSEFVADAIRSSVSNYWGPVKVVPYAVDLDPLSTPEASLRSAVRRRLGVKRSTFVVGYSFAATSNFTRKNPVAAIMAFRLAFPNKNEDVGLIIRSLDMTVYRQGMDLLRRGAADDPRILILDEALQLSEFYAAIDTYIAPTRSEGYGLNLVEASQIGLPVIATRWSLSSDILARPNIFTVDYSLVPVDDPQGHYQFVSGAVWAEPKVDELAACLREMRRKFVSNFDQPNQPGT